METSKIKRLMMGLVILCSFFLFQGSDDAGCAEEFCGSGFKAGVSVTIINDSNMDLWITALQDGFNSERRSYFLKKGNRTWFAWEQAGNMRAVAWLVNSSREADGVYDSKRLALTGMNHKITFR